jgi:hypothetical protein
MSPKWALWRIWRGWPYLDTVFDAEQPVRARFVHRVGGETRKLCPWNGHFLSFGEAIKTKPLSF